MAGVRFDDPEPIPRVWDAARQMWSDDWKRLLLDAEKKEYAKMFELQTETCTQFLEAPERLIEIVDLGIKEPVLAINALAEVLE